MFLNQNGFFIQSGKNDRMTWDASIILLWDSQPIRDVANTKQEPKMNDGTSWVKCLEQFWNIRIYYPYLEHLLWDDDAIGSFKHIKFNP